MKRAFLLLVILAFCAQAYSAPALGLRLGLNSSNATHGPDDSYKSDPKAGLILGGAFEAAITTKGNRTIRLEAAYVQKGWQDSNLFGVGVYGKAEIDEFVFTPAMIFRLSDKQTIPYILVGMDIGLTMKAEASVSAGGFESTTDIPNWNSTDFGLDFGAGMLFPSGSGEFLGELRFSIGVTDMYPGSEWDPMMNGVEFIFGYNFSVPSVK